MVEKNRMEFYRIMHHERKSKEESKGDLYTLNKLKDVEKKVKDIHRECARARNTAIIVEDDVDGEYQPEYHRENGRRLRDRRPAFNQRPEFDEL